MQLTIDLIKKHPAAQLDAETLFFVSGVTMHCGEGEHRGVCLWGYWWVLKWLEMKTTDSGSLGIDLAISGASCSLSTASLVESWSQATRKGRRREEVLFPVLTLTAGDKVQPPTLEEVNLFFSVILIHFLNIIPLPLGASFFLFLHLPLALSFPMIDN